MTLPAFVPAFSTKNNAITLFMERGEAIVKVTNEQETTTNGDKEATFFFYFATFLLNTNRRCTMLFHLFYVTENLQVPDTPRVPCYEVESRPLSKFALLLASPIEHTPQVPTPPLLISEKSLLR